MKKSTTLIVGALAAFAAIALCIGVFVVSGYYDIGADDPHLGPIAGVIASLREHSIARRAAAIEVPNLEDPKMISEGAEHYWGMCTGCHLAPGMTDSEIRPGLNPKPPNLVTHAPLDPRRAFWVIKHGIKMSAMPAWGTSHSDAAIWNMVAFLRKMPHMSVAQYHALIKSADSDEGEHDHGHDEH